LKAAIDEGKKAAEHARTETGEAPEEAKAEGSA
jgi:hypothetical protein